METIRSVEDNGYTYSYERDTLMGVSAFFREDDEGSIFSSLWDTDSEATSIQSQISSMDDNEFIELAVSQEYS